ncbi:universal stress protein [Metabacillus dongyingensis]|uniref:universal stress protein n=1 Tax=Metabacillus dongyingensis TaxID=2874282 RepID=UPI003B8B20A0
MIYKRILVAIDGSEGSKQALEHGSELAKNYGAELTLIHVKNETRLPLYGGVYPVSAAGTQIIQEEAERAEEVEISNGEAILRKAKEAVSPDIKVNTVLLDGDPAASICGYTEKNNIDLIVMGSRGLSGIKKWVLGSVSQKVLSESTQAVLITK